MPSNALAYCIQVREFYENQNQTLAKYVEVDELLSGELVHSVLHSFENPTETTSLIPTEGSRREENKERWDCLSRLSVLV
jgi:hypothetical protein